MHYAIADLEKYTGIKAHTIRMWEQRYNILEPHRTDTNIRYYDDEQLKKLLNVASLVRTGMRISKISQMSEHELIDALDRASSEDQDSAYEREINNLINAALTYNEELFQKTFANCLLRFGLEETYISVLNPLLTRTGLMWSKDEMNVCQEHFISNLVRQKLYSASDQLARPRENAQTWVLFLPDQEEHDIGLLYANFLIRQKGHKVIYLGQRVPFGELVANIQDIQPDNILTFIKHTVHPELIQDYLEKLDENFGSFRPFCAGSEYLFSTLECPGTIRKLSDPHAILKFLS